MLKICPYVKCYLLSFVHSFTSSPIKVMYKRAVFLQKASCRSTFSYSVMSHFPESVSAETDYHNMNLRFSCKSSMFMYKLL